MVAIGYSQRSGKDLQQNIVYDDEFIVSQYMLISILCHIDKMPKVK